MTIVTFNYLEAALWFAMACILFVNAKFSEKYKPYKKVTYVASASFFIVWYFRCNRSANRRMVDTTTYQDITTYQDTHNKNLSGHIWTLPDSQAILGIACVITSIADSKLVSTMPFASTG